MASVQGTLDFTRGEQLSLRRDIDLPPGEKFLLWILDDHIGSGRSWAMTMATLQAESGYGKTATYNYINGLWERGLVWWDELGDGRRDFRICWPNVAETIESTTAAAPPAREPSSPRGKPVRHADSQFAPRTDSSPDGQPVRVANSSVRHADSHIRINAPLNDQINAPSTPSTPGGPELTEDDEGKGLEGQKATDRRQLLRELQEAGVGAFVSALEAAEANGASLGQVAGVMEHFRLHPGRWPPEVLYTRLTRPEAQFLAADEGWFGELPAWTAAEKTRQWRAQQERAALQTPVKAAAMPVIRMHPEVQKIDTQYGAQLDAMTTPELLALLPEDSPVRRIVAKQGAASSLVRPELLIALKNRECPKLSQAPLFEEF